MPPVGDQQGSRGSRFEQAHEKTPAEPVRAFLEEDRERQRAPDRDARVQRVAPGRAQERARLGLAAVPVERPRCKPTAVIGASTGPFGAVWVRPSCARRSRPVAPTYSTPNCRSARPPARSRTTVHSRTRRSANACAGCWATSFARARAARQRRARLHLPRRDLRPFTRRRRRRAADLTAENPRRWLTGVS